MAKKKKKYVFKLKDSSPEGDNKCPKAEPAKPDPDEVRDSFALDLMNLEKDIRALSAPRLDEFFDNHLMVKGMRSHEKAIEHIHQTCKSPQGLKYVQDELDKYLKRRDIKPEPREEPKDDIPDMPESAPDFPDEAENKYKEFEDYAREMMEVAKAKLQEQLDRLTICEARLDTNDEQHKSFNEWADATDAVLHAIKEKVVEEIRAAAAGVKPGEPIPLGGGEFTVKYDDPKKKVKKMKGVFPKEWKRILELASSRINILMVGPSGCGKTYLAKKVAEALDLRFASLSCSEGMDEGVFQGIVLPIGEKGNFEYVPSQFVDFYEYGGVFLFDELDNADSNLMAFTNSATGNDYFYLPRRFKEPLVKRHPDFVLLAAANTYGHGGDMVYNARNQLDGATLDRFRAGLIELDYSEKVEKSITDPDVYDWALWVRKGIEALKMNRIMSTRVMEDFTKLKAHHNWEQKEFEKIYFQDWNKDDVKRIHEWIIKEIETIQQRLKAKKDKQS